MRQRRRSTREHVAGLALQLYDATAVRCTASPPDCRDYLEAAALLANVGLVISHSKHHLHSYYVIRNSELAGLTDDEIEMIALVARYHRKSEPKPTHVEFEALSDDDKEVVRTLAGDPARRDRPRPRPRRARRAAVRGAARAGGGCAIEAVARDDRDVVARGVHRRRAQRPPRGRWSARRRRRLPVPADRRRRTTSAEDESERGELQRAVALDAVAGAVDDLDAQVRLAAARLGDVGVVDHR